MLEKSIKKAVQSKFNRWVKSLPEDLQTVVQNGTVITGGCFPSMIMNEEPNDYDIYFKDYETAKKVAQHYASEWNANRDKAGLDGRKVSVVTDEAGRINMYIGSAGVAGKSKENEESDEDGKPAEVESEEEKYKPVFITSNAISLSDKIQLIVRFYGEPEKIHETFDFVHTKAYWKSWETKIDVTSNELIPTNYKPSLVIPKDVYEAVINKALIYTGSLYPVCSLFRIRKFIKRGWNINAGQIVKIAFQISKLNLSDIPTLKDQLIGVDSTYFNMMIDKLNKFQEKSKEINEQFPELDVRDFGDYLSELIDEVF